MLTHKYDVDEIYDATVVQPIRIVSEDGSVEDRRRARHRRRRQLVGGIVTGSSEGLRRLQTGSVRAYAASLFLGVVMVLGYYLWR